MTWEMVNGISHQADAVSLANRNSEASVEAGRNLRQEINRRITCMAKRMKRCRPWKLKRQTCTRQDDVSHYATAAPGRAKIDESREPPRVGNDPLDEVGGAKAAITPPMTIQANSLCMLQLFQLRLHCGRPAYNKHNCKVRHPRCSRRRQRLPASADGSDGGQSEIIIWGWRRSGVTRQRRGKTDTSGATSHVHADGGTMTFSTRGRLSTRQSRTGTYSGYRAATM